MKNTKYTIVESSGKFHVRQRTAGTQYSEPTGKSFFSKAEAKHWITCQENAAKCNEIVLRPEGNTYAGPLGVNLSTRIDEVKAIIAEDRFSVVEVMPDGELVLRAIQSTYGNARSYMNPDRVLIYSEKP